MAKTTESVTSNRLGGLNSEWRDVSADFIATVFNTNEKTIGGLPSLEKAKAKYNAQSKPVQDFGKQQRVEKGTYTPEYTPTQQAPVKTFKGVPKGGF